MIDYSERKSVSPNRPRAKGGGRSVLGIVVMVALVAYGAGVVTGFLGAWYARSRSEAAARKAALTSAPAATPSPDQQPQAGGKIPEPPLTFYETLPKGKVILGTGLNLPREEGQPPAAAPGAATPPASGGGAPSASSADGGKSQPASRPAASQDESAASPAAPQQPKPEMKGRYVVQVASYSSKDEAEAMRKKLAAIGIPAYISETTITGKGVWYRVRAGKNMDQKTAAEMAAKTGKGSIVILE